MWKRVEVDVEKYRSWQKLDRIPTPYKSNYEYNREKEVFWRYKDDGHRYFPAYLFRFRTNLRSRQRAI